jgi:hypothetical protein
MDSAYMGDAMCQVGYEEWGINMVGTCQTDRTGAVALGKLAVKAKRLLLVVMMLKSSLVKSRVVHQC